MKTARIYLDGLVIHERYRRVDDEKVAVLAASMKAIGLQQPISVWAEPDENGLETVHLVAGLHRVRAAEKLGWEQIDAVLVDLNDIDRRRWEIAENLHRSELTALERDQHVAEWIKLTEESDRKVTQPVSVSNKGGRGKESGVRKAAKELGVNREDARRAVKVASLTEEAKEVAREVGLDDNRSALLAAAAKPAEEQAPTLRAIAEKKHTPAPEIEWNSADESSYAALLTAWERATEAARREFSRHIRGKLAA